jgi:tetratricopeptide (TPR) repeat protein
MGFPGMGSQGSGTGGFNSTGGINTRDLAGCELRASLPGFRSDEIPLSGVHAMDRPDVGTIVLHRYANVEGTTISMTSLQAPKEAKKAFESGRKAMDKKKWAEAKLQLEKAVGLYPQYAAAWCDLGRTLEESGNIDEARKAYAQALTTDTKFVTPYIQLAGLAVKQSNWREVADTTDRVVKLNPADFPGMYLYNSVANYNLKEFTAAEKSAREVLKLDTEHRFPQANHLLGVILARRGEFTEAAAFMKTYLQLAPGANDIDLAKKQLDEVEKFAQAGPGLPR